MKIKKDFILRQVADIWVVMPVGAETVNFNGMLSMNQSAAFLWNALESGSDINDMADSMVKEYGISHEQALSDVAEFCGTLQKLGCLED